MNSVKFFLFKEAVSPSCVQLSPQMYKISLDWFLCSGSYFLCLHIEKPPETTFFNEKASVDILLTVSWGLNHLLQVIPVEWPKGAILIWVTLWHIFIWKSLGFFLFFWCHKSIYTFKSGILLWHYKFHSEHFNSLLYCILTSLMCLFINICTRNE